VLFDTDGNNAPYLVTTTSSSQEVVYALDTSGNQLWSASPGGRVAIDDADDAFVCGGGSAALLGPDGSTQWSTPVAVIPLRADVTNAVGRCIGEQGSGIGIVAFQVQ
jgi:hypothetical protein